MTTPDSSPNRTKIVFVVLGVVIAGSLFFTQFLGEPTTERLQPAASEPTSEATPPSAPESLAPTPTALTVPSAAPFTDLPDGSSCASVPGDPQFGTAIFIDLDDDGDSDAISPERQLDSLDGLVEFGVYISGGNCDWKQVAKLSEGSLEDARGNVITHSWTCSHGERIGQEWTTNLVQVASQRLPTPATSITQFAIVDGELREHHPILLDSLPPIDDRSTACDPLDPPAEQTVTVNECGGRNWRLKVPDGWLTTVTGSESCRWFTQSTTSLPCFCDATPAISISVELSAAPLSDLHSRTVIDGYPAYRFERLNRAGMGGLLVNSLSYVIDIGDERLVLAANTQDWRAPWEEVTAQLDRFVDALDINAKPPTTAMFYPDFPDLASVPLHLDPAGVFAWYGSADPQSIQCDDPEPNYLTRLTIGASRSDDLQFTNVGPIASGQPEWVRLTGADSAVVAISCIQGGSFTFLEQSFMFDTNGAITNVGAVSPAASRFRTPERGATLAAVSPDGRHRYASGEDPLGRLDYGCTNGSMTNPSPAKTLLRYASDTVAPAFPDGGLTGQIRNMVITSSGFAVWESHSCQSAGLYLGRLIADGSIVDRHLIAAQGIVDQTWTIGNDDELIILTPRFGRDGVSLPALRRLDMANSPGWVITADPPLRIDDVPIADSLSGDGQWRLGENGVSTGQCVGDTIYADEPGGPRRVSNYLYDIEGSVVDVVTSEVVNSGRVVVALVECPDEYEGFTVWFAHEGLRSRTLNFVRVNFGPVRSVQNVLSSFRATVELLDGTTTEMELSLRSD